MYVTHLPAVVTTAPNGATVVECSAPVVSLHAEEKWFSMQIAQTERSLKYYEALRRRGEPYGKTVDDLQHKLDGLWADYLAYAERFGL